MEALEGRDLPSTLAPTYVRAHAPGFALPQDTPGPQGYTPAQIRHAYGIDQIALPGGAAADGTGTTIAIVDAYDNPAIAGDLHAFDVQFGLPDPVFTKINQNGGSTPPAPDPGWAQEIALDVEWAHAVAPKAGIVLVESSSDSLTDLVTAVSTAAHRSGVVAVSMSWGGGEFSGQQTYDHTFTTPAGHGGVTFVASAGDSGAPAEWPASSPNVLGVGGTTLSLTGSNTISSESAWADGGGGVSTVESLPAYQNVLTPSPGARATPDVAYNADPNTGFPVYDTYTNAAGVPWSQFGGTSAGAPQWAALVALADQGRTAAGKGSLDGATQTLPLLYQVASADFHDITAGSTFGFPTETARPGYDLATGRGTPVANLLVPDLIGTVSSPTTATSFAVSAPTTSTAGSAFSVTVTALDSGGHTVTNYTGRVHFSSTDAAAVLPGDYTFATTDGGSRTFTGVALKTVGTDTVRVTDASLTTLTGGAGVTVSAAAASQFRVAGFPTSTTAGVVGNVTVTAVDAYGNSTPNYTGTVHFSSTDPAAVLPADTTLTNGTGTFGAILRTAGSRSLTVTDTFNGSFTGTESGITVTPAAPARLAFGQQPVSASAGAVISPAVTVQLFDSFNNLANNDNGRQVTLVLGNASAGVVLGGSTAVLDLSGLATFGNLTVSQAGTGFTLTASATGLTTATSNPFNVSAAPASSTLEDFESSNPLSRYTAVGGGSTFFVSTTAAHDGGHGLIGSNGNDWIYRNDAASTVRRGDTISGWIKLANVADGRAYLGFGASAAGTLSVVLAPNTGQLLIQSNSAFGFTDLAAAGQRFAANHWYRVVVSWGSTGTITVQLYDSNGTTLLNSVTATTTLFTSGGIAFRATGNPKYFDTITVTHGTGLSPQSQPGTTGPGGPIVIPAEDSALVFVDVLPSPAATPAAPAAAATALDLSGLAPTLGTPAFVLPTATTAGPVAGATVLPAVNPGAAAQNPVPAAFARSAFDVLDGGGDSGGRGDDQGDEVRESWLLEWLFSPAPGAQPGAATPGTLPAPKAPAPPAKQQPGTTPRDSQAGASPAAEPVLGTVALAAPDAAPPAEQRTVSAGWALVLAALWCQRPDGDKDPRQRPGR